MNLRRIEAEQAKALKGFRHKVIFEGFRPTLNSWNEEKPNFKSRVGEKGGELTVEAGLAETSSKGAKKWIWLNAGTKIRWAVMSSNWKSKTKPRRLKSGGGRGKVIIAGRKAMQRRNIKPRKGIDAREWTQEIFEVFSPEFADTVDKANKIALDNIYK